MDRINLILHNEQFQQYCEKNKKAEKGRKYCKHQLTHFADVARIAYILNLEQNLHYQKDCIYACGLLHDIGKWRQYEDGTPHDLASTELAKPILQACLFSKEEAEQILSAILTHRNLEKASQKRGLNYLLYLADKKSRPCFQCKKEPECNWPPEQKNQTLQY